MGNAYNYLVSFSAAIGGLLFGYEIGVVSQVLGMESFQLFWGTFGSDPAQKALQSELEGNVTFSFLMGCVFGAIIVSFLADRIGRKWCILIGGFLFSIGGTLQSLGQDMIVFYSGRITSGVGIGILSMVVPIFISETAPTKLRGTMITIQQLMITIGILIAAIINAVIIKTTTGDFEWRLALGMQVIPGVILFLLTMFMPYSPRWLADKDRDTEALQVICRLRGVPLTSNVALDEFEEIKENIRHERSIGEASWAELLKTGIFNRVVIAVVLQFFQQWTGINVIMYYQQSLLEAMGFSKDLVAIPLTIANDFINFIATFPGMYLIEKLGRRSLLIYGGYGMGISLFSVCVFTALAQQGKISGFFSVVSVYFFILCFASSWGPVVWVYQAEIFPQRVRAKGVGLATLSNWSWNAVIAKITPLIRDRIGVYTYLIFGSMGFLMATFTYAFVPETAGKSLEDMDELFGAENTEKSLKVDSKDEIKLF